LPTQLNEKRGKRNCRVIECLRLAGRVPRFERSREDRVLVSHTFSSPNFAPPQKTSPFFAKKSVGTPLHEPPPALFLSYSYAATLRVCQLEREREREREREAERERESSTTLPTSWWVSACQQRALHGYWGVFHSHPRSSRPRRATVQQHALASHPRRQRASQQQAVQTARLELLHPQRAVVVLEEGEGGVWENV
jgi:hypothetical protein